MSTFAYRAVTLDGTVVRGAEDAVSTGELERALSGRGLYPLEVRQTGGEAGAGPGRRGGLPLSRRADVTDLFTTLATLLQAGLPLDRSLEVAARGAAREDVREAVTAARQRVREGGRLADAFAGYPRLFPPVAVGLVRAAERGSHLPKAVERLAEYLERERALRARITSAMMYPLLMVGLGGTALLVLLLFVLPRFVALLQESGSSIPGATALLIGFSSLLTRGFPLYTVGGTALVIALVAWRATPQGRPRYDALVLRIPLLGALRARHVTARLAYTVSTLLAGGVPLLSALDIAQDAIGDTAVAADIRSARDAVRRGEAFSAALARSASFPYAFVRLVEVGEETGELDVLLQRAAGLLESELQRRLERLVALVEPAMIVVFGGLVGFVALALLQAIYGIHADGL